MVVQFFEYWIIRKVTNVKVQNCSLLRGNCVYAAWLLSHLNLQYSPDAYFFTMYIWQPTGERDSIKLSVQFRLLCNPETFANDCQYSGTVCHGSELLTILGRWCVSSRIAQWVGLWYDIPRVPVRVPDRLQIFHTCLINNYIPIIS
jgi:hypothetical protein